jgi:putative ABC transport system ATP-binding protein
VRPSQDGVRARRRPGGAAEHTCARSVGPRQPCGAYLPGDRRVLFELPALLAGRPPKQARRRREELLAELGLTGKERSMPGELSVGEQQRVALARALVNHPDLLLADEPSGSLDSRGTREVMRLLSRFHGRGQTIVLVTHDARLASAADRVISFFDGRIADDAALDAGPSRGRGTSGVLELKG